MGFRQYLSPVPYESSKQFSSPFSELKDRNGGSGFENGRGVWARKCCGLKIKSKGLSKLLKREGKWENKKIV